MNFLDLLEQNAALFPDRKATILASGRTMTFAQIGTAAKAFSERFVAAGIRPGMRVATFVRPGLDFVPVIFGLLKVAAVPVLIDPGMKLAHMLACVSESQPEAIVGVPLAQVLRILS